MSFLTRYGGVRTAGVALEDRPRTIIRRDTIGLLHC
jgi:hypothetical protein